MKTYSKYSLLLYLTLWLSINLSGQQILFNNGNFVTHPGSGPGGSDYSLLTSPLSNYGFGNQYDAGRRVADDFTVTGDGWIIDSIVFFEYQTGSSTTTTFTATYLQIWKGSALVWGDLTTNRLKRSAWSGCYRGDDFQNSQRPIMRNTCTTPSLTLQPGTYNIDWQADGSLSSGPWCVPVTYIGSLTTGDAQGYYDGEWVYLYGDTLDLFPQGLPFIVYGRGIGTPSNISINESYTFAEPHSLYSYKIIGLPGQTNFSVSSVITGTPGQNWMAFRDNGAATDYMKGYDGSSNFNFQPGNAFWVTSENKIEIKKTVGAVPLTAWDTYVIPVNAGSWTLISNPFEKDVKWEDIRIANGLDNSQVIWDWLGYWSNSSTLRTGKGYYFLAPSWVSSLHIPYDSKKSSSSYVTNSETNNSLTLSLYHEGEKSGGIRILFHMEANSGMDKFDIPMPSGDFEKTGIRLITESPDNLRNGELFLDARNCLGDGQSYRIRFTNRTGVPLSLQIEGVEHFSSSEIFLVIPRLHKKIDLKSTQNIDPGTESELMTLLIGDPDYINRESDRLFSDAEPFFGCTPNPADEYFTVRFSAPADSKATIVIYDLSGRKLATLIDGFATAGYHEISSASDQIKPGIYLCKMDLTPLSGTMVVHKVIRLVKR